MSANATALRQARATATPCAGRFARTGPVRVMAVAVPRKVQGTSSAPAARPAARTEKAALTAMAITETAAMVHLINASSFQDFLAQHTDKLVVCDFYAVWCGPCKMIAPELERLANELDPSKVIFAKMDCGADNESKKLAISLGIKALPTFHLYREARLADTMTGAKVKSLEQLIQKHA